MKKILVSIVTLVLILTMMSCSKKQQTQASGEDIQMMKDLLAKFAPTVIKYDTTLLDQSQREVLQNLYYAAVQVDSIFLDQVYSKNEEIKAQLMKSNTEQGKLALELFNIMFGPFNRLDHDKPFYGNETKPLGANFYPADMTKEAFQSWINNHPDDEAAFTSEFTIIRRQGDSLVAIPYSEAYKKRLTIAADYLKKAAQLAKNETLKKYLLLRADAFLSNDYFDSDMAWMDLTNNLVEPVIGPYEVYEDGLFNYKASFEAFLTIRDPKESEKLARFAGYLTDIEKHLPEPEKYKNFNRGNESPIVVAQEVFSAGDTKAGVQTLAFNLPNDERVRKAKGSKKVLLKNVNEAKFEKLLKPISDITVDASQLQYVTFDAFFNHVLMHEMSHGVGPGIITVDGRKTEVKKELKETYSTIEECKADVLGMYNNIFMIEKGEFPETFAKETWVTFLAGVFRSVRFGINEAHGAGTAIIFNYLLEEGGYEYDPATQKVKVNFDKIYDGVEHLATKLLTLQATGDYEGTKAFIAKYAVVSPPMKTLTENLAGLPVDIRPIYQIQQDMENK